MLLPCQSMNAHFLGAERCHCFSSRVIIFVSPRFYSTWFRSVERSYVCYFRSVRAISSLRAFRDVCFVLRRDLYVYTF